MWNIMNFLQKFFEIFKKNTRSNVASSNVASNVLLIQGLRENIVTVIKRR